MRHPNPNMLLRIGQADAYCAATEYLKSHETSVRDEALQFRRYLKHPRHKDTGGRFTDDTQMSIAVTEVLLSGNFTREAFAHEFVATFKRDPRDGYARGFQAFLESVVDGPDFLARIRPDSDKNGAAMRAVPIGVLPDPKQVLDVAEVQARVTHDTPDGVLSAQAVALMSHFALHVDEPLGHGAADWHAPMVEFLDRHLPAFLPTFSTMGPTFPVKAPRVGVRTAQAVFILLSECKSLMEILERVIQGGGDTDSVAAIAWGIASTHIVADGVPDFMVHQLEPGRPYGPVFLRDLGADLMRRYA